MASDIRFIGPVERLLYLRTLPTLGMLPPEELATIAHQAKERFFKKGATILQQGERARSVFFIVEGRVSTLRNGRLMQRIEPPYAVGFLPVLSADPEGVEARADVDTLTLELGAEDLIDAMEDNFALLEQGIRQLSRQLSDVQRSLETRGLLEREEPKDSAYPERELDLVDRLTLLRQSAPYRAASLDSLAELARRSSDVRYQPGDVIWRDGAPSDFGIHIVHGVVSCVGDEGRRRFRMGPGSVIGYMETLGGLPRAYQATAETRIVGMRGEPEAFFDVLEDNFSVGFAFVGFLAQTLTHLYVRLAETDTAEALAAQAVPGS